MPTHEKRVGLCRGTVFPRGREKSLEGAQPTQEVLVKGCCGELVWQSPPGTFWESVAQRPTSEVAFMRARETGVLTTSSHLSLAENTLRALTSKHVWSAPWSNICNIGDMLILRKF